MSDFRFAGRWLTDRRVMTLSGDAFKAFVTAGTWMVENRSDGRITADDLELIPRFHRASITVLVTSGLWIEDGGSWLMTDYHATQTSRAEFEVLENARRREREKKARQRERTRDIPGDIPGEASPGPTQARQGQARKAGQADVDSPVQNVVDWPTAVPGRPGAVA